MRNIEINGVLAMAQKLTRFNVTELKTIRVTCQACGLILEAPVNKASAMFSQNNSCPSCKAAFHVGNSPVAVMAQLITQLANTQMCIEFEIPEPG
jgi:hypothetical protein